MPSFPPRYEPIKKEGQLEQRKEELEFAIKRDYSIEKLIKAAEKYRASTLSYFKAKIHVIEEKELQRKPHNMNLEKLKIDIQLWMNKTTDEIINEIKAEL
jgi:hypothetical protein